MTPTQIKYVAILSAQRALFGLLQGDHLGALSGMRYFAVSSP